MLENEDKEEACSYPSCRLSNRENMGNEAFQRAKVFSHSNHVCVVVGDVSVRLDQVGDSINEKKRKF